MSSRSSFNSDAASHTSQWQACIGSISRTAANPAQPTLSNPHFDYVPLDAQSQDIRLFSLFPADSFDDEIAGGLLHASLETLPVYETVSYVWGDASICENIRLQYISSKAHPKHSKHEEAPKLVPITTSLALLLRHLRHSVVPRLLWVDAICIDQYSNNEKGHQVQLMATIYKLGSRSNLWLGEDEEGVTQALQLLDRVDLPDYASIHIESSVEYLTEGFQYGNPEEDVYLTSTEYNNLSKLFGSCELWMRIWILQEIVFAPQPVLICGQQALPWKKLAKFSTKVKLSKQPRLWNEAPGFQHVLLMDELREIHNGYSLLIEMRESRKPYHSRTLKTDSTLYSLLAACSKFRSSDERDKLYALLNVARDDMGIEPNYNISASEMWTSALKTFMRSNREITSEPLFPFSLIKNLPSWIRLFRRPLDYEHGSGLDPDRGRNHEEVFDGWRNESHKIRHYDVPNEALNELVVESTRLLSLESSLRGVDNVTLHDILHFWEMAPRAQFPLQNLKSDDDHSTPRIQNSGSAPELREASRLLFTLIDETSRLSRMEFLNKLLDTIDAELFWYLLDEQPRARSWFCEAAASNFTADGERQQALLPKHRANITCNGPENCKFYQHGGAQLGHASRTILETLLFHRLAIVQEKRRNMKWCNMIIVLSSSFGEGDQIHYVHGSALLLVLRPVSFEKDRFEVISTVVPYAQKRRAWGSSTGWIVPLPETYFYNVPDGEKRKQITLV